MRARIQKSMVLVLTITLLISYAVMTIVVYSQNLGLLKSEVRQEARYIRTAINISGPAYLEQMDDVDTGTRVTRIDTAGCMIPAVMRRHSIITGQGARYYKP